MLKDVTKATLADEIKKGKGLQLLNFHATWCGVCKMLSPVLKEVSEKLNLDVYKVDVDHDEEFAKEMGVSGTPTTFVYKDGKLATKFVGYRALEQIKELLETLPEVSEGSSCSKSESSCSSKPSCSKEEKACSKAESTCASKSSCSKEEKVCPKTGLSCSKSESSCSKNEKVCSKSESTCASKSSCSKEEKVCPKTGLSYSKSESSCSSKPSCSKEEKTCSK
ncbi:thioredoxin family protein [Mesomycoplasma lagogenitalium]|uniref:Thioredoxin family protein n=1 Tax=Mesomycoplasma lagogenitalium TaxID=171286 RepID=A0ABY8LUQ6_9BACT|nr:thioredoxin family protein [Mesomycoplasma lagogenitalium]WGI36966.1 thioredoxin family protein [Mesomycoplasma lagogenitalium]